ncbi:hypothetical protein [Olleya sp. R77988]|uniref:hypothetical protein n=1 Tax=Olleya sp. R77988 TaxID=3093875 RepID=UPI0037C652F5
MKKTIFLLAFLITTSTVVQAQDWVNFKSEKLEFIADYPAEPTETIQEVDTAVGKIDMYMIMYSPTEGDDNAVYSVIRSDYPKDQFVDVDEDYNDSILDGAVNGATTNVQGTLIFDNKVTFNGYPGRSIKIETQGIYIYINAYLVENTMFITQVLCTIENDNNKSIKRFMDSFNIIKVKQD